MAGGRTRHHAAISAADAPMFGTDYIFGIHEPGGEQEMLNAGRPGWIVFTEGIGHDPQDQGGRDYRAYSQRGLGVICRLNNGYHPEGTIPYRKDYADFARRCANFVAASRGCKIWIIGNEMNYAIERPQNGRSMGPEHDTSGDPSRFSALAPSASADAATDLYDEPDAADIPLPSALVRGVVEETITPALYAECYRLCREAIHAVPSHEDDQVLIGAVAPWNNQTQYPGNPNGDWVQYFHDILLLLGQDGCDGITLHTYTHQADPNLIRSDAKMNAPFQDRHYEFRAYQDFMQVIPATMRHLPVYITETDQDVPWLDANIGWVQQAYGEIDWWNRQPGNQQIRALVLYRWPRIDKWYIEGKGGVIADFRQALQHDYRWGITMPPPEVCRQGDTLETLDVVNLRRTPDYQREFCPPKSFDIAPSTH